MTASSMLRRLLPLAALAILTLAFYRQAAFTNLIFARGDTLLYFYPYWDYRAQVMLAGRLPLWNPYLFMGVPFLANSQAGVFYPLNWPLILFPAPVAVKLSLVMHILIAAWGTYALARRFFALAPGPATLAAAVFAMGGYVTAQSEHVNQLQGLAWLPLALLATHLIYAPTAPHPYSLLRPAWASSPTRPDGAQGDRRPGTPLRYAWGQAGVRGQGDPRRPALLLTLALALQLTAGHTQTAFISLVACGLTAAHSMMVLRLTQAHLQIKDYGLRLLGFSLAIALAFALTAIQLLPTLELSRLSLRGGGLQLNEAVSFSLNPLLLGRALLPGYSRVIFSEFVAYIGVIPFLLACFAIYSLLTEAPQREVKGNRPQSQTFEDPRSGAQGASLQSLISPHLKALQSPFTLAALLVGFGLFFALGGYNPVYLLLARFVPGFNLFRVPARWLVLWALGAAVLAGRGLQRFDTLTSLREADQPQQPTVSRRQWIFIGLPLLILIGLAFVAAPLTPAGELGPIGLPAPLDLALWLVPPGVVLVLYGILPDRLKPSLILRRSLPLLAFVELGLAAQSLSLNHLTTPDAYASIRPALTQMLAANTDSTPPARVLSLSALEFDPGDLGELHSAWDPQLPADAVYDAVVATKHKEVLSPNLPLTWQVPSVDGYDGGILPLRAYAEFAKQFGEVPANTDGRLRQFLKTIPPNGLLNLTHTRWIITDKTGDAWIDNIFYDLGLSASATSATPLSLAPLPNFQATALGLVLGEDSQSGVAQITFAGGGAVTLPILYDPTQPAIRLGWEKPAVVARIDLLAPARLTLRGASLIDERTDTFKALTLGPYRLVHSGDVKIYENLNVYPRAFLVQGNASCPLDQPCLIDGPIGKSEIVKYEAEHIQVKTTHDTPGYLLLTDAYYPGWNARVDNQPVEISKAQGLFRQVSVPAGSHTVDFRFEPQSLKLGAVTSAGTLLGLFALFGLSFRRRAWTGR